jgi:anti-sigma B factor antagonist
MAASSDDSAETGRNTSSGMITTSHTGADLSIAEYLPPDAHSFTIPDGRVIVILSGELDIAAVPVIREAFTDAIGRTKAGVIADLARVSFIDSSGFGALADAASTARHLPGGLAFTGIPGHMTRLLRRAGLSELFLEAV